MTMDRFFKKLGLTKDTLPWEVLPNGKIRAGCICPIEAVAGKNESLFKAIFITGLSNGSSCEIMHAADYKFSADPLRKRILATLGLQEAA
jgi:hypothetical protein